MPTATDGNVTTHNLLAHLSAARSHTDALFRILSPEALYDRPIAERHRIVFYIGHLEAFDWNLFHERLFPLPAFDPEFDNLFAFGIDPVDGGLPTDQPRDWPSLERVRAYVNQVRQRIDDQLSDFDFSHSALSPEADVNFSTLLHVAIEHRLMHAETLAYMFHQLPHEKKIAPSVSSESFAASLPQEIIEIPVGTATLGLAHGEPETFGWDNEFERHTIQVPAFAIENHKVTNRQYLRFIEAGGYQNHELWSASGWEWKASNAIVSPVFWKKTSMGWKYRTMFHEISLPLDWPVYVSHAEASAYARWAGMSLPTEAQWHRAAYATPAGPERQYPWGDSAPDPQKGNFDFAHWDPTPVGAFPAGASAFGVDEMVGNGWEWTATPFAPFSGFKPFSFYPGYSANFFDGKHYIIKGGSARTAASMLRRSFRNWFQPHYQYVYAGFRCVSN